MLDGGQLGISRICFGVLGILKAHVLGKLPWSRLTKVLMEEIASFVVLKLEHAGNFADLVNANCHRLPEMRLRHDG